MENAVSSYSSYSIMKLRQKELQISFCAVHSYFDDSRVQFCRTFDIRRSSFRTCFRYRLRFVTSYIGTNNIDEVLSEVCVMISQLSVTPLPAVVLVN